MSNIHVLVVSEENWIEKYQIPDNVDLEWFDELADKPDKLMDLVILDRNISREDAQILKKITRGFCLYATEQVDMQLKPIKLFFERKMGQYIYTGDIQEFLNTLIDNRILKKDE